MGWDEAGKVLRGVWKKGEGWGLLIRRLEQVLESLAARSKEATEEGGLKEDRRWSRWQGWAARGRMKRLSSR